MESVTWVLIGLVSVFFGIRNALDIGVSIAKEVRRWRNVSAIFQRATLGAILLIALGNLALDSVFFQLSSPQSWMIAAVMSVLAGFATVLLIVRTVVVRKLQSWQ